MKIVDRFNLYSSFQNKAFKGCIYYKCQTDNNIASFLLFLQL